MSSIQTKIMSGALVLDVRSPDEFADGAYPGALNIPVDQLLSRLADLGDTKRSIVVYCASGGRSSLASQMLKASGFTDVLNAGGLDDMPN
jgi:phage shock protein E